MRSAAFGKLGELKVSTFFVTALTTLLTTVNPIESVGPFLGLTMAQSSEGRLSIARRATLVSTIVLFVSAAAGALIFRVFGISLPAFRIAGGILLFTVGMQMLNAQQPPAKGTSEETTQPVTGDDVAVFPLAIPLIAGPGAVASILILSEKAVDFVEIASLYGALALTQALLYFVLTKAELLSRICGPIALKVVTRLMGLILAALATQFVIDGLIEAFPALALAK